MKIYKFSGRKRSVYLLLKTTVIKNSTFFQISKAKKRQITMRANLTMILLATVFLQISVAGYAQKVSLDKKNASLKEIFAEIQQQTGFSFVYTQSMLEHTKQVSIKVTAAPLEEVLKTCLFNQAITYSIEKKVVVLKRLQETQREIPPVNLSGKVTDTKNGPLPGVSVKIKGSKGGTTTDQDGNFKITLPDADVILVFTYVGYEPQEIKPGADKYIKVVMKELNARLNEVVVVGYGSQRKTDITGSIVSVKGEEIANRPVASPMQALNGKAPGVTVVSTNGVPGQQPNVRIRGIGSTNNNQPLFVVDGMFLDDIQFLSPSDIAGIQVLKDASSLAIYGVRGANGVIIITTKSGKAGDTQVALNSYAGYQTINQPIKLLDAEQYATLVNEAQKNAGLPDLFPNPASLGKGTNWLDVITQNAMVMDHNLSISGGTEKNTFNFSTDYFKQNGVVKKSSFDRLTLRLNDEYKLNKSLKLGANISFSRITADLIPNPSNDNVARQAYWFSPTTPPYNEAGNFSPADPALNTVANPLAILNYSNNSSTGYRLVGTTYGELKFLKDFTFRSSFGTDLGLNDGKNYTPVYSVAGNQQNLISSLNVSRGESASWLWENTLNYDHTFGKHQLKILAGYTLQSQKASGLSGTRTDVPADPNLWYLAAGNPVGQTVNNQVSDYNAFLSGLARINYAYAHKYLLTLSYRRDGSSKFSPDYRYGNFAAVGLGWNISEEAFMKDQTWFDLVKLRGSWGVLGNDKIKDNAFEQVIVNNLYGVFGPGQLYQQGATQTTAANPFVKWEKAETKDLGIELASFENRLSLEVDYYNRLTKGMLLPAPILASAGFNAPVANAGSVSNKGIEVNLKWVDKAGELNYNLGFNFATVKNKILSLAEDGKSITGGGLASGGYITTLTSVGHEIGEFYGYKVLGVFQNQAEVNGSPAQAANAAGVPVGPGDLKFADIDGNGIINASDRTYMGSAIPKVTYGFNASFEYKGFDFSFDLQGAYGNKIYNAKRQANFSPYINWDISRLGRWNGEGTSNSEPRIGAYKNNYEVSDYFLESGSYLRINNVQLGYNLPKSVLLKLGGLTGIRVFLSGQNVYTFTKYTGFTPEIGGGPLNTGVDQTPYPLAATFTAGLNLKF